jgi:hypothetical protein
VAAFVFVEVPFPPGIGSDVLVAMLLVLVAMPLALNVLLVTRSGIASPGWACGTHGVGPLT